MAEQRCCAECRREFTDYRPAVQRVELREYQPGSAVPRLKITASGSLCAECARQQMRRMASG